MARCRSRSGKDHRCFKVIGHEPPHDDGECCRWRDAVVSLLEKAHQEKKKQEAENGRNNA